MKIIINLTLMLGFFALLGGCETDITHNNWLGAAPAVRYVPSQNSTGPAVGLKGGAYVGREIVKRAYEPQFDNYFYNYDDYY